MTGKARWLGLGIGLLLIVAAFGLVFLQENGLRTSGVALAQGAPTPTPGAQTAPEGATTPAAGKNRVDLSTYVDAFWNALAKQFGVTVDEAKTKVTAAQKDVIEQMVKDGKLTRAQGDKLEQAPNTNKPFGIPFMHGPMGKGFGFRGGPRGGGFGHEGLGSTATLEAVAKALNLQPSELTTQLRNGKTLADIATAQKVDQAVVKQAIIDATKAEVQRQVADGVITQAQADQILSNLTPDKIDLTKMPFFGKGMGWR